MLKRIITSIISICILLPILFLSDTVVLPIAVAIMTTIALYEMNRCLGNEKNLYLSIPAYLFAIASPFALRFLNESNLYVFIAFVSCAAYMLYLFFVSVLFKGHIKFAQVGEIFTTSVYIIAAFNSIIYIRDIENSGKFLYILIFIGAWITDIFAYFTGMWFGKHKLIPEVSPKKTVEGSIGGVLFCTLAFIAYAYIIKVFFDVESNIIFLAISAVIISIISQMGDLIMSLIKREYGIKDYGKLFPGHGGVLDRFDSILAVSLAFAVICIFAKMVNLTLI